MHYFFIIFVLGWVFLHACDGTGLWCGCKISRFGSSWLVVWLGFVMYTYGMYQLCLCLAGRAWIRISIFRLVGLLDGV